MPCTLPPGIASAMAASGVLSLKVVGTGAESRPPLLCGDFLGSAASACPARLHNAPPVIQPLPVRFAIGFMPLARKTASNPSMMSVCIFTRSENANSRN